MDAVALVSGGKDSIYSAYLAETQGLDVDELLVLRPDDPDSGLFHTPNLDLVRLQAEAWGKAHRSFAVAGTGEANEERSVAEALAGRRGWVVAGAIASSYQWSRLHRVTHRLGLRLYTPLWGKPAHRVVEEEIAAGLDIRFVHLAAEPLPPELLGSRLDRSALERLRRLDREVRRLHVAGEGGEFETLVVDAPFFARRLVLDEMRELRTAGTHRLNVARAHLGAKATSPTPE